MATEHESRLLQGLKEHVARTADVLGESDLAAVGRVADELLECYRQGRRVFVFGNGGSAAAASHLAEDLAKGTVEDRSVQKRLRVLSLADSVPFISALGNDWGYETVFREQLITLAEPGDAVIAISGSGNSPNVVSAVRWARENNPWTAGLTGFNGGKLKGMVDVSLHCPVLDMEIAENAHLVVVHLIVGGVRARVAAGGKPRAD